MLVYSTGVYFAFNLCSLFESFFPAHDIFSDGFLGSSGEDIGCLFDWNPSYDSIGKFNIDTTFQNLLNCSFKCRSDVYILNSQEWFVKDTLFKGEKEEVIDWVVSCYPCSMDRSEFKRSGVCRE